MSRIKWDQEGQRLFETGAKNAVLYVKEGGVYKSGVAWNGLIGVTESPSGAEPNPIYADDIKYLNIISAEDFSATIEAYTYPDEFMVCDGSAEIATGIVIGQQNRLPFALVYKTSLGNDTEGIDHGYKLHIIYGAQAAPSEKSYQTINETPEAITFSWELSTTPVPVTGRKPTAILTINSTKVEADTLKKIEDKLFGDDANDPTLMLPDEVVALIG